MLAAQGTDGVYTTMTQFLAAAATAYVVAAVVRVFSDEESGLGEAVLAGAVSRWRWLLTAVAAALLGSTVLMFFAGLGNGLGAGITLGEPQTIWRLTLAGLAFVPAMAVLAGIAALAVAVRHPWIGWLAVTFVVISLYLGALLRLPRWLIDASPVGRTTAPTDFPAVAMAVMVVVAAGADTASPAGSIAAATRSRTKGRNHEDRSSSSSPVNYWASYCLACCCSCRRARSITGRHGFLSPYYAISTAVLTVYLLVTNPAVLQRRMHAGPTAETRTVQKIAASGLFLSFAAVMVVSALDHRFGWSQVPTAVSLAGNVLVVLGLGIGSLVVIQNSYAAANITVEEDQKVVSTGLYGLVRHPMYFGSLIMLVGFPLALGSYWGLVVLIPIVIVLAVRILDEEKALNQELVGYSEYTHKVHHRLVPFVW